MLKHLCFFSVSWSFLYIINTGWYEFCLLFTKSSICEQIDSTSIYTIIQLVQSLSCVRLFVTPWTAARQTSLFITNSQSLCKLMSIESMMPCNFLISVIPFSHLQSSVLLLASINLQLSQSAIYFFTSLWAIIPGTQSLLYYTSGNHCICWINFQAIQSLITYLLHDLG